MTVQLVDEARLSSLGERPATESPPAANAEVAPDGGLRPLLEVLSKDERDLILTRADISGRGLARLRERNGEPRAARQTGSSDFKAASWTLLQHLNSRSLADVNLAAIMLDATDVGNKREEGRKGKRMILWAIGYTMDGTKVPLGCAEEKTESESLVLTLLRNLKSRGLDMSDVVAITDGGAALTSVIPKWFAGHQRCILHVGRQVSDDNLSKEAQGKIGDRLHRKLRQAWQQRDPYDALIHLEALAAWLESAGEEKGPDDHLIDATADAQASEAYQKLREEWRRREPEPDPTPANAVPQWPAEELNGRRESEAHEARGPNRAAANSLLSVVDTTLTLKALLPTDSDEMATDVQTAWRTLSSNNPIESKPKLRNILTRTSTWSPAKDEDRQKLAEERRREADALRTSSPDKAREKDLANQQYFADRQRHFATFVAAAEHEWKSLDVSREVFEWMQLVNIQRRHPSVEFAIANSQERLTLSGVAVAPWDSQRAYLALTELLRWGDRNRKTVEVTPEALATSPIALRGWLADVGFVAERGSTAAAAMAREPRPRIEQALGAHVGAVEAARRPAVSAPTRRGKEAQSLEGGPMSIPLKDPLVEWFPPRIGTRLTAWINEEAIRQAPLIANERPQRLRNQLGEFQRNRGGEGSLRNVVDRWMDSSYRDAVYAVGLDMAREEQSTRLDPYRTLLGKENAERIEKLAKSMVPGLKRHLDKELAKQEGLGNPFDKLRGEVREWVKANRERIGTWAAMERELASRNQMRELKERSPAAQASTERSPSAHEAEWSRQQLLDLREVVGERRFKLIHAQVEAQAQVWRRASPAALRACSELLREPLPKPSAEGARETLRLEELDDQTRARAQRREITPEERDRALREAAEAHRPLLDTGDSLDRWTLNYADPIARTFALAEVLREKELERSSAPDRSANGATQRERPGGHEAGASAGNGSHAAPANPADRAADAARATPEPGGVKVLDGGIGR